MDWLVLRSNRIKVITEGLFQNLVNLDNLSLFDNKIEFSDQYVNIFQGIDKLRALVLAQNRIKHIPEGLFRNLVNAKGIDLSFNRIASIPEGFFCDLKSLKYISINENKNEDLSKSISSNITICEESINYELEADEE